MQEQEQAPPAFRSPLPLFQPASIAIVGASERAKWPTQIYQQLRQHGFPGPIYPVNPRSSEVWGLKCYPDLASLPQPPAHALVIVPAPAVQGVLETGVAADLKSATVYAAQLGEGSDPEIVARGLALKELIQRSGLVLCGPNCMGFNAVREKNFGYPNADLCTMTPGAVAFVTQSGGTVQYIGTMGAHRGVRFNYLISSGNELSLDLADYVNHFAEDDSTRVIALFVEGIRRPQAFMTAAQKALAAGKPIIAIKTGKSQKARDSAQSHTGAIAGDYGAFTAMCERYGIVICHTLDDMVEMLLAFQYGRYPKGSRVGWMTTSGGTVDLLFDHLEEIGAVSAPEFDARTKAALRPLVSAELALKNPLDAGNPVSDAHDAKLCAVVASDPNIDMLAWGGTPPSGSRLRDPAVTRSIAESTDKPVIGFIRMGMLTDQATVKFQDEVGFPFLQGLPAVIRTLGALAFYGARKGRSIPALPAPTGRADNLIGAALDAALNRHGLTLPRSAMAKSPQEAGAAAAAIGFPVALKIVSSAISHKTEVGGVRLHLASQAEVERAAHALAAAAAQGAPGAPVEGFLVQEMVEGVEMIVGARTDALYGPMLVVGAGGILVELVRDVVFRLLPITPEDVRAMIGELKAAKLLAGFRGRPAADVEALIKAICGLSEFYLDHRHLISDIEINPLIVRPGGVRAVDVRLVRPGTH
ncbi:MAG: acetate--CoA ligase family protein [Hyphomicrobiales bacterium]|nr:acetate--CoA ligase family protein [Hyphomicrobiales bacterium]